MTTAAAPAAARAGCGGDGCAARDPWPLHHIRHRGVFCRLCTSCVLKYHPGSFCSSCFQVFDPTATPLSSPPPALIHCSKCPSISHVTCLPSPDLASHFVCPACTNPDAFSFPAFSKDGNRREIDLDSAKVLLAASTLAAASMNRAMVSARLEAERKAKEAALSRKRAKESIEKFISISKKEREKTNAVKGSGKAAPAAEVVDTPKKKMARPNSAVAAAAAVAAQKRVQNREREKWMRFHEIPLVQRPTEIDKVKGVSVVSTQSNAAVETKERVGNIPHLPKKLEPEEKKAIPLNSQGSVKEEKGLLIDADKGPPRIAQTIPDASIPASNPRAIL
ncbi:uncharacterized protein [Typha latifolia]|uniref:uncharacterized protein n=1 Tax=Typha latifolia TaxID=4733 RepID=UPI003C2AB3EB